MGPPGASARTLLLGEHPPRADAERNVEALLAATRDIVVGGDLDPTAAEIAARAGVGVGTLYRRALRKETLLAAVVVDLLDEVCGRAADVGQDGEPWDAFVAFALDYLRIRQITCRVNHSLEAEFDGAISAAMQRTRAAFRGLTGRLHELGALDPTVTAEELMFLLASLDPADTTLGLAPSAAVRDRAILRVLEGLRPRDTARGAGR